jgi:hypothetical protein
MADTELVGISGADLVAFKAALGAIFYMTPISSQTVSSPVDHIDLTLPTGYSSFLCTMAGVGVDGAPGNFFALDAAFSANGSTFISDQDEFDTYAFFLESYTGIPNGSNPGRTDTANYDGTAKLMGTQPFTYIYTGNLWVNPGAVGQYPSLLFDGFFRVLDDGGHFQAVTMKSAGTFFPEATVAPTLVRHSKVRLLPGGADPNDPSSAGLSFGSGSFNLYGVPSE